MSNLRSVQIFEPPLTAAGTGYQRNRLLIDAADLIEGWRLEKAFYGGHRSLSFAVRPGVPTQHATNVIRLMCEVEIPRVFAGLVWELRVTRNGETVRYSVDDIYNCVRVHYTNESGTADQYYPSSSTWTEDSESIARYGRRETEIRADRNMTADEAESYAKTELARLVDDTGTPLNTADADDRVEVVCLGFWATANNRYVPTGGTAPGSPPTVSTAIDDIVDNYCDLLTAYDIDTNSVTCAYDDTNSLLIGDTMRAGDALKSLAQVGSDGALWRIRAEYGGRVIFKEQFSAYDYEFHGRRRGFTWKGGALVRPAEMEPAVYRNMTLPTGAPISGAFLDDTRDRLMQEIVLGEGDPFISAGSDDQEAEIRREQRRWVRWLQEAAAAESKADEPPPGGGSSPDDGGMLPP